MAQSKEVPFLPGYCFSDIKVTRILYRKTTFANHIHWDLYTSYNSYKVNAYRVQPKPIMGIGAAPLENSSPTVEELLARAGSDPDLMYGQKRYFTALAPSRFLPAHVAFDKVVNLDKNRRS